jgi:tetratricopeptide (TPR) repeat protein
MKMTTQFMITAANLSKREAVSASLSLTVGRSEENDIQLPDPKVSRFHCKIENTDQGIMLFDLVSKNGSYVNGVKCDTALLNKGDILKIGDNIFSFTPLPTLPDENHEKTIVIDALPLAESLEMRTRQFEENKRAEVFTKQSSLFSIARKLPLSSLSPGVIKLFNLYKQKTIYLAATGIFCLALIFFLIQFITDKSQQSISPSSASGLSPTADPKKPEQRTATRENIEKANQIAREANTILATGDFAKAISLFNDALSYDANNLLAKEGIAEAHASIDRLANICFTKGQQGLKEFKYKEALKEFETVMLLLKDRSNHRLYVEAKKLLEQAQLKVSN